MRFLLERAHGQQGNQQGAHGEEAELDEGPDARFEFGLALLVNGLGTMARKK